MLAATTASTPAAASAAPDAPAGAAAADGHAAVTHQPQPAARDTADTQVESPTHGSIYQTKSTGAYIESNFKLPQYCVLAR